MSVQNLDSMDIFQNRDVNEVIKEQNLPDIQKKLQEISNQPDELKKHLQNYPLSACVNIVDLLKAQNEGQSITVLENKRKQSKESQENEDQQNANQQQSGHLLGDNNLMDNIKIEDLVEYFLSRQTDPYYKSLKNISFKVIMVSLGDAIQGFNYGQFMHLSTYNKNNGFNFLFCQPVSTDMFFWVKQFVNFYR